MKTAKELFEELGYKYVRTDRKICFLKENGAKEEFGFEFWLYYQEVYPVCHEKVEDTAISFTMQELKAINKQVEELQW